MQVTKDSITAEGSYKQLSLIVEMQMLVLECKDYKTHTRCARVRGGTFWSERKLRCSSFNRCNWCSTADGYNSKGIATLIPTKEESGAYSFSEAILTTDLITKETCYEMIIDGKKVAIAGVAKGSGMIHPNMATMLSFITTDAHIEHDVLQTALSQITNHTFNQITVDGDTSTNDIWSSLWQVDYQKQAR